MKIIDNKMADLILAMNGVPINCHKLVQKSCMSNAHGSKLLNILKDKDIIELVYCKSKRERRFALTEKGNSIRDLLLGIRKLESE